MTSGALLTKPGPMAAIAICCADVMLRERLERLLRATTGVAVAGTVSDMDALAQLLKRSHVDLLLADGLPQGQLNEWHRKNPATPIVALVGEADVEGALDALHAGAAAILRRSADRIELAAAIEAALNGLAVVPFDVLGTLLDPSSADVGEPLPVDTDAKIVLTPRELEVLAAMADGASNKAIARRLGISFHTAKFHVAAILAKLDADSRTEAVTKAAHLGLVML
jgi:two-component system, NarL family, response regulator YdfI